MSEADSTQEATASVPTETEPTPTDTGQTEATTDDLGEVGDQAGFTEGQSEAAPPGSDDQARNERPADLSVEDLVDTLESVSNERDQYLDALRRLQAEFENYRKAVAKRELEAKERANEGLVSDLLPVLDACDGAVANGSEDVALIQSSLVEVLTKLGLTRVDESEVAFDPEIHEAVLTEDGDEDSPVVAEVLRVGYQWKGRTLRAAMVKVRH